MDAWMLELDGEHFNFPDHVQQHPGHQGVRGSNGTRLNEYKKAWDEVDFPTSP